MFPRLNPNAIRRLTTTSRLLLLQPRLLAPVVPHIHRPQEAKKHTLSHKEIDQSSGALSELLRLGLVETSVVGAMGGLTVMNLFQSHSVSPEKNERNVVGDTPIPTRDYIEEYRKKVGRFKQKLTPPPPGRVIRRNVDLFIKDKSGDTVQVQALEFEPADDGRGCSEETIFYVPGTAYVASEANVSKIIGSRMAWQTGMKVIIPYPRLAPECSHEIIFHDVFEILMQYLKYGKVNPAKLILSGYSNGGGLAANIAIRARQAGIPILAQFYQSGLFDHTRFTQTDVPLYKAIQDQDNVVPEDFIQTVIQAAIPDGNVADPEKSPLLQDKEKLRQLGLPMSVLVVGNKDRTFADTILYADMLNSIGVKTVLLVIDEGTHGYWWNRDDVLDVAFKMLKQAIFEQSVSKNKDSHVYVYYVDGTLKEIETEALKEMGRESNTAISARRPG